MRARPSGFCFRLQYFSLILLTGGASIGVFTHHTLASYKVNCACSSLNWSWNDRVLQLIGKDMWYLCRPWEKSLHSTTSQYLSPYFHWSNLVFFALRSGAFSKQEQSITKQQLSLSAWSWFISRALLMELRHLNFSSMTKSLLCGETCWFSHSCGQQLTLNDARVEP